MLDASRRFQQGEGSISDLLRALWKVELCKGSLTALPRTLRRAQTEERRRGNFLFSLNFAIENINDVQQKSRVSHISLLY